MMLVGTCIQTDGWIRYQPNGTFYSLQLPPFEQRILTQCSPATANLNSSYPTVRFHQPSESRTCYGPILLISLRFFTQIWLETGGGGHGMADLWPLRDALNFQGFEPNVGFINGRNCTCRI
jgi:hypothetical protein